jgi:uncharacterized membrane-anchored protein
MRIAFYINALLLLGLFIFAKYPLWIGDDLYLKVLPVDPVDPMRGRYVNLRFEASRFKTNLVQGDFAEGDTIYVSLDQDGKPIKASSKRPNEKPFLKGKVKGYQSRWNYKDKILVRDEISVLYGLEAFFAQVHEAKELETKELIAHIKVAPDGEGRLVSVQADRTPMSLIAR